MSDLQKHFSHHIRFYISFAIGIAVWFGATYTGEAAFRTVLAGDSFFLSYLVLSAILMSTLSAERLRERSDFEDEGIIVIVVLTIGAVALSLWTIFTLFHKAEALSGWHLGLAIASVPLGWIMLHTVMASHYGHLYYIRPNSGPQKGKELRGLEFPGTSEPNSMDFLYHAFVIGMTAQVSDIDVMSARMRRMILVHSVVSFFYNTVLLALAVNMAVR